MSLPSHGGPNGGAAKTKIQPSIRSFFQPKQPSYATPPSSLGSAQPQLPVPPPTVAAVDSPAPIPPPLPLQSSPNGIPIQHQPPPIVAAITPTHHPNITISPILPHHISTLRHITARLLPVRYPDSFYGALSDPLSSGAFSRVLLWTDMPSLQDPNPKPIVIGGLVCRPERSFQARPGSAADVVSDALYIQSLVLNEPYRRLGLAGALLDAVCQAAARDERWHCRTVCAHVWTENRGGMDWYDARGFQRVEPVVVGYYRQLSPNDAWIVRREIKINDGVLQALGVTVPHKTDDMPGLSGFTNVTPRAAPPITTTANPSISYQTTRPDMEWNDLPAEMARHLTVPQSGGSSGASSRSSSSARKKKERAYPAAAFGN